MPRLVVRIDSVRSMGDERSAIHTNQFILDYDSCSNMVEVGVPLKIFQLILLPYISDSYKIM